MLLLLLLCWLRRLLSLFKVVGYHIETGRVVRSVVAQQLQVAEDATNVVVRICWRWFNVVHRVLLLVVASSCIRRVPEILK